MKHNSAVLGIFGYDCKNHVPDDGYPCRNCEQIATLKLGKNRTESVKKAEDLFTKYPSITVVCISDTRSPQWDMVKNRA